MLLCASYLLVLATVFAPSQLARAARIELYGVAYNARKGADWWAAEDKCKTQAEVDQDVATLRQITTRLRIYSLTDCGQGQMVMQAAKELGMSVFLGLWVSDNPEVYQMEKQALIEVLNEGFEPGFVQGVAVGSEAVYRNETTPTKNIQLMNEIAAIVEDYGHTEIPVTLAEIGDIYLQYPNTLIAGVDTIFANSFPFWEEVPPENAVDYMLQRLDPLLMQGKEFILSETGWATSGDYVTVESSVASGEAQATFFQDFYCRVALDQGMKYFWFSGIDDDWRLYQEGYPDHVEGHFGLFTGDLELKPTLANMEFSCGDSSEMYKFELGKASGSVPTASPVPAGTNVTTGTPTTMPMPEPTASPIAANVSTITPITVPLQPTNSLVTTDAPAVTPTAKSVPDETAAPMTTPTIAPTTMPLGETDSPMTTEPPTTTSVPDETASPVEDPATTPTASPRTKDTPTIAPTTVSGQDETSASYVPSMAPIDDDTMASDAPSSMPTPGSSPLRGGPTPTAETDTDNDINASVEASSARMVRYAASAAIVLVAMIT